MIDLKAYRCPLTGETLRRIPAHTAEATRLREELTLAPDARLTALLSTPDGETIYSEVDEIPQLMERLALRRSGAPGGIAAQRLDEVDEEVAIYDSLAQDQRGALEEACLALFGPRLCRLGQGGHAAGPFPDPPELWVDSISSADSQYVAYRHLAPLRGRTFLQLGGSGSHAVKALLGGAAQAALLSPSQEEILLGRAIARRFGVEQRFIGIRGIGERIPVAPGVVDCVYGGGCLHHTEVDLSLPEIARVLPRGGTASFVDPRANAVYRSWSRIAPRIRFCGDEEGTHDHPLDIGRVRELSRQHFAQSELYESGGPLRYGLVLAVRVTKIPVPARLTGPALRLERRAMRRLGLGALYNTVTLLLTR